MEQEVEQSTGAAPADAPLIRDGAIHSLSPLDGRPLTPVPVSSVADVEKAVETARRAQKIWRNQPLEDRIAALKRVAKKMLERRTEILQISKREAGKLDVDALFTEALGPLDSVGGWARVAKRAVRRDIRLNPLSFPKKRARIDMVPRGVIAVIAPWNYPVAGLYRSLFPALMTGNAVVLKPSEYTPRSSAWFAELLAEELPDGVIQVVQGDGVVGAALIEAGVDACVFTGSCGTGKKVRVRCAELGIPASVEMGGNDPAIVLADCDLDRTVAGITHWSLHNAGQACGAVELIYVDKRIADRFVKRLADSWRKLRVGEGDFAEVEISPLTTKAQLEHVEAHISDAVEKGATLVVGGKRLGVGFFHEPTILDRCNETMDVVKDETFGPVVAIVRVDGAAEAIRRTNESRYGLGASLWTEDLARAERLAERLEVGVVDVNNHAMTGAIPDLPWSGMKDTGFGIANSELSLTTFCRPRSLLIDGNKNPEPFWMPFDPSTYELGDILADVQIARVGRAWKLPVLLGKRMKRIKSFFKG